MRKSALLAAIVLVAASLIAQETAPVAPRTQAQTDAIERGSGQFSDSCAACHGEDATGGRGPDLIQSALVRHDKNGDLMAPVIKQGRPDKGMPVLGLTDEQISGIVAFLHSLVEKADLHTRVPGGYPDDIPAEKLATGDVEAGKTFFNGAGGCSKCHSPTGDLAGIASHYTAPDLQSRFLNPPPQPRTATVTLASGKQISGVVSHLDEFNVAIKDADGKFHSWSRKSVKVEVKDPLEAHHDLQTKLSNTDMHNLFTYLETLK